MSNTFRFEFVGDLQVGAFSYSARSEGVVVAHGRHTHIKQ